MFAYPTEVQGRTRGHSSTHSAELGAGQRVPVAERRSSTETVLQLGQQRGHRLVAVFSAPLRVTPGAGGRVIRDPQLQNTVSVQFTHFLLAS